MTDPIPAEAVEAAARELYIAEHAQHPGAAQTWDDGYKAQEDWMLVWFARALVALTAAAPLIVAQERTTAGAMTELFKAEHEKNRDLRAGIEALRDEWRAESDHSGRALHDQDADYDVGYLRARQAVHASHADALDALLRERAR